MMQWLILLARLVAVLRAPLPVQVEIRGVDGSVTPGSAESILLLDAEEGLGEATGIVLLTVTGMDTCRIAAGHYSQMFNTAKSGATWYARADSLEVWFQMPGTAWYTSATYRVDDAADSLFLLFESSGDPSWDAMDRIDSLLTLGLTGEAAEELGSMMYPHHYYRPGEMGLAFLQSAWSAAGDIYAAGEHARAIEPFDRARTALDQLFWEHPWYAAWASEEEWCWQDTMTWDRFVRIANDYGFYLCRAGRSDEGTEVLRTVMELDPDRPQVYLNLADALWEAGEREESVRLYEHYLDLLTAPGTSVLIPPWVLERTGR